MRVNNPVLVLTFLGNDLTSGHSTTQSIDNSWIVNHSIVPSLQLLNGLKSSSDQFGLTLFRRCPSVEDIIATEGNIRAQLYDGESIIFTGFISTSYSWTVTDHGESALAITIESVGTRLFSKPFIEYGYHFFDTTASTVVYEIINPLGLQIRPGDERKLLQPVRKEVEAGKTCRELLDSLFYECNAVYTFNAQGQLCVEQITASTAGARVINSEHLYRLNGKAISLSKSLRTYKGARLRYSETSSASDYLVYRNTTSQDTDHPYCNLKLGAGEWFDGAEIYTAQEWSEATADQFREPTLISAVNASSESSVVGSGKIIAISNAHQLVVCDSGITCQIECVGGKWFKITAHNTTNSDRYITRMDLYADIIYEKSQGVIRTQIQGSEDGKSLLEEELTWIHDKDNAQRHGNLLAQYHRNCGANYTFYSELDLDLGSVIKLNDDVYSGLEVFVLIYAAKGTSDGDLTEYKAVGISTFDLDEPTYHGTTQPAHQSGAQGPAGEPGATAEIQYAIGTSIINPPVDEMLWGGVEMLWGGETMLWQQGLWTDEVPDMERGKYIWMRTRTGDSPWQYTRLTGSTSWDNENLGVCTTACPTQSKQGLGLIPGDYFTAGAQFVDGGVTYKKGYAYVYNGSSWDVLDLSDANNSGKALQCLSDLMTSGINVTDSTASIYGWFQNLVAQNAVINSLVVELATIKNLVITGNIFNDVLTTNNSVTTTTTYTFISSQETIGSVTRERLKISDIESAMGSSSISVLCTGTVVIAGTSYTGTLSNPISVKYVKNTSLRISQGSQLCWFSYSTITNEYLYEVSDKALSSNALTVTANVGSISVHSVLPQNSNYDNLASNEIPFNKGWIKELFVKNVHGLNYNYAGTTTLGDYITDIQTHSTTFTYDGEAFVNVRASLTSSDLAVNSGLMPLRAGSYATGASGCVCMPLYSGGSIYSSFIILEFSINPVSGTITYRAQGATSSREIYVEFQFFK